MVTLVFVAVCGPPLVVENRGYPLVCGGVGFIAVASPVAEHRLEGTGSAVVAHELSCPDASGIFPHQGLNPCPLYW